MPGKGPERPFPSGEATICAQSFGDPGDPPVLLVMGQMASMLWWPEEFCERLAATGRFVIRFDHRDTGRSTGYPPGDPRYSPSEMRDDGLAVLDGYGIERAHLLGISMGGAIVQALALENPDRILGVTAISTTPISTRSEVDLPPPSAEYMEHAGAAEGVDWTDEGAVKAFILSDCEALAGTAHTFDEASARELIEADFTRADNPLSIVNHELLDSEDEPGFDLAGLSVPLLVIHGTADPLFPFAHGQALANEVEGAQLVAIEGGGHELHREDWDRLIEAIAGHTAGETG